MDKKAKKRMDVLHQKLIPLRRLLADAKQQPDDPAEIPRLQKEIAAIEEELAKLKAEDAKK